MAKPLNIAQCTDLLYTELYKTGQMFLLRRYLSNRLTSHGWSSNLRWNVINYVKERGQGNINISHMWSDLSKISQESAPEQIKTELRNFLSRFAQEHIEIDDSVEPPPNDPTEDEVKYEIQDRDAVPELPSADIPSPNPVTLETKPPWLFIYDGNRSPTNSMYNGSEADSDIVNNENHYSESSYESSVQTTPEHGATNEDRYLKDAEDYQETATSTNRTATTNSKKKLAQKSKELQAARLEKERDRKKRLEKARLRQQFDQAATIAQANPTPGRVGNRLIKKPEYDPESNATGSKKGSKQAKQNQSSASLSTIPPSPQLSAPLRQLKIDKKCIEPKSPGGTLSSSKLSPSSAAAIGKSDQKLIHKTEVIEEEEEELMDV